MPLPALAAGAGLTLKYGIPVAQGAWSLYDRRVNKKQNWGQAVLGAGAETAVGMAVPGLGSAGGKALGILPAVGFRQTLRRAVGTGLVSSGASLYSGFQADNLSGVNAQTSLVDQQPGNSYVKPIGPGSYPSRTSVNPPPVQSYQAPVKPINPTPWAWGGLAVVSSLGLLAITRGRMGGKELTNSVSKSIAQSPAGADLVVGAGKIATGASKAATSAAASVSRAVASGPTPVEAVKPLVNASKKIISAADAADLKLAAGQVPVKPAQVLDSAGQVARQIIPPSRLANVSRAAIGAKISQVNPQAGLSVLSGRYGVPTVRQAVNASASIPTATAAATATATAVNKGLVGRASEAFLKNFSSTGFAGEFGKQLVSAVAVAPALARLGIRRPLVAAPVAAAALVVPTAATVMNRRVDAQYGTNPAWWDSVFFGGNINKTLGTPGTENLRRDSAAAVRQRDQDARLEIARIQAASRVEAGADRTQAQLLTAAAKNPLLMAALANSPQGERLGLSGLANAFNTGSGSVKEYRGPAFGPQGPRTIQPMGGFAAMQLAPDYIRAQGNREVEQIRAGVSVTNADTQARTQRYQADRNLDGTKITQAQTTARTRIQVGGQMKIAAGDQYTRRYQSDRNLDGIRVRTAGDVQIQGIKTQGDVRIAAGDQYTRRYQSDNTLKGQKYQSDNILKGIQVQTAGTIRREELQQGGLTQRQLIQTDGLIKTTGMQEGTKRYQSDNQLRGIQEQQGTIRYQSDNNLKGTVFQAQGKVREAEIKSQTDMYQSDNQLRSTQATAKATEFKANQDMIGQVSSAQAAAAGSIQKAFMEADPELATAYGEDEFKAIKLRRALEASRKQMRTVQVGYF